MNLSILYRGPLSSCNYACDYCPFAKRTESSAELARDRECLERFTGWVRGRAADRIGVLFTPWGEALVRRWYQDALAELTQLPHVVKAAIQTNISCKLDWVERCDKSKLALWCTFHPGEITRERFLAKCQELLGRGVRFSVGVVGLKEHFDDIRALRDALPPDVYLWVNAYKRGQDNLPPGPLAVLAGPVSGASAGRREGRGSSTGPPSESDSRVVPKMPSLPLPSRRPAEAPLTGPASTARGPGGRLPLLPSLKGGAGGGLPSHAGAQLTHYYTPEMITDLTGIDPLFPLNNTRHASRGEACRAGAGAISVDGDGNVRRCHFIKDVIGNIYSPDFESCLRERPCANETCGCHIGYVHLDRLKLYDTFGDGVLERVPLGYR